MNVATVGIDLAKNVFSVHGVDSHGKVTLKKRASSFFHLPFADLGVEVGARLAGMYRPPRSNAHFVKR